MIRLNLTDEQKKAIADILKKYQETLKADATTVLEARKTLFNTLDFLHESLRKCWGAPEK